MRLAAYLGSTKSLDEFAASMTHREYRMWMQHLEEEWNRPSRTDYYLMQAALEARYAFRERPSILDLNSFKVTFKASAPPKPFTPEEEAAKIKELSQRSQSVWAARVGLSRAGKKQQSIKGPGWPRQK